MDFLEIKDGKVEHRIPISKIQHVAKGVAWNYTTDKDQVCLFIYTGREACIQIWDKDETERVWNLLPSVLK